MKNIETLEKSPKKYCAVKGIVGRMGSRIGFCGKISVDGNYTCGSSESCEYKQDNKHDD